MRNHPIYLNIAVHYIRPKQSIFAREAFQTIIREVIDSSDLDLEADPCLVRHTLSYGLDDIHSLLHSCTMLALPWMSLNRAWLVPFLRTFPSERPLNIPKQGQCISAVGFVLLWIIRAYNLAQQNSSLFSGGQKLL